jgi:hypothetical protein
MKLHFLMPVIACGAATRRGGKPMLYSMLRYLETPTFIIIIIVIDIVILVYL